MTSAELNKLAARVEALQGPCRETNWAVMDACGVGPRDYTGSIDAAATLVPEGWCTEESGNAPVPSNGGGWSWCLSNGRDLGHAAYREARSTARTEPLSRTAAALRARAAIADGEPT